MKERCYIVMWVSVAALGCPGSPNPVDVGHPKNATRAGLAVTSPNGCHGASIGVRQIRDWSAARRSALMSRVQEDAVAMVVADSCGVELMPACLAPGKYVYGASPADGETVGSFDLSSGVPAKVDLIGDCAGATHVVVKVFVGTATPDEPACTRTSSDGPPAGCDRPLKLELADLAATPMDAPPPPPPLNDPAPMSCGPDDPLCNP